MRAFSVKIPQCSRVPKARILAINFDGDVQRLNTMSLAELRKVWLQAFGAVPSLRSPDLLGLVLAWRLQAKAHGGIDPATRRKLKGTGPVFAEGLDLGAGARLTRKWEGQEEEVLVSQTGFDWRGESYPSLSAVAFAMTGSRKNGPKFFGLRGK